LLQCIRLKLAHSRNRLDGVKDDPHRRTQRQCVSSAVVSYRTVMTTTSVGYRDQLTTTSICKVSKQYEAYRFHPDLPGSAFLLVCDETMTYAKNPGGNGTTQSKSIFFDALGYWMSADPVAPREELILDGAASRTGQYSSTGRGHYHLKSFVIQ
jgi:hypothetical protein